VEASVDEAHMQHRDELRKRSRRFQRRQQTYWRVRKVPESQGQAHRGLFAYSGHALRRLPLSAHAFWMLGTEFARLLGLAATPTGGPATATTPVVAATRDAHARPAYRWRRNRYFDSTDDLLLFCLLYHKAKATRLRYTLPPTQRAVPKDRAPLPVPSLAARRLATAAAYTQEALVDWLRERRRYLAGFSLQEAEQLQQCTVSRWLRRGSGRLVEALGNYRHGTDEQQKIARRICKLSAELYEQVYGPSPLPTPGTPLKARRPTPAK